MNRGGHVHRGMGGALGGGLGGGMGGPKLPHIGAPSLGSTMHAMSPTHLMPRPMAGGLTRDMPHLAAGGMESPQQAMPWFVRQDAREIGQDTYHPGGLINSTVAGRTDRIPLAVAADSHVIPADVVSGLGQGNTMNGAQILGQIMQTGPYGTAVPRGAHGAGPPRPPHMQAQGFAEGGAPPGHTSILAAGGEFIVPPEAVRRLGAGDMKRGHDAIDRFIKAARVEHMKFLRTAPEPKK